MAEAVTYKKPRRFNIVVVGLLLALVAGLYLAWVYVPVMMRQGEVTRVLDEISSEFTGQASRMLADKKTVEKLMRDMRGDIQAVGVNDPDAEYWIEIDSDDQIRFGVLYSDWIELPFVEPKEKVVEIQMFCTRQGRGTAWTCEAQDLQSPEFAELDELE